MISIVLAMSSCVKDVDGVDGNYHSILVLDGIVSTDAVWSVDLSKSRNILSKTDEIKKVDDANVVIVDLTSEKTINLIGIGNGQYINDSAKPIQGHTYEITISHDDFTSISAKTIIPKDVEVIKKGISTSTVAGQSHVEIDFVIVNQELDDQYYVCEIYQIIDDEEIVDDVDLHDFRDVESFGYLMLEDSDDSERPSNEMNSGVRYLVESDNQNGPDGITGYFAVSATNGGAGGDGGTGTDTNAAKYEFRIMSVSKEYFNLAQSLHTWIDENNDNSNQNQAHDFFTNVKNGHGIFGSVHQQSFVFE